MGDEHLEVLGLQGLISMAKKGPVAERGKNRAARRAEEDSDMEYDAVDKFHATRSKIMLSDEESFSEDGDEEEEVMQMASDMSEEEEEGGEEYEEEDDVGEEGEEEEYDNNSEGQEGRDDDIDLKAWGKKKQDYYSADYSEGDDDEEEEAKRLQKERAALLNDRDYFEESFDSLIKKEKDAADKEELLDGEDVQVVERDLESMTVEQKREFLDRTAPEMKVLLQDLKRNLDVAKNQLEPLLQRAGEMPTNKGLKLLQAKYLLMMSYCANISFYIVLKCEGKNVKDHPVIDKLVKFRMLLDKIKPLEAKMKYQIDKYIRMAHEGAEAEELLGFKPKPDNFADDEGYADDANEGVYKAPKVAPVFYDQDRSNASKEQRKAERQRKLASKSRVLKELREEFSEQPEEIVDRPVEEDAELQNKFAYEEDNFMRFTLSKKELAKLKKTKRFVDELDELDDFGDIGAGDEDAGGNGEALSKYLSKLEKSKKKRKPNQNGDEDYAFESKPKRSRAQGDDNNDNSDDDFSHQQNDFYDSVKRQKEKQRAERPRKPVSYASVEDMEESGDKRKAGYQILKNKGLTPHRSKEVRNPRVKQRSRFDKATKKLKSFKPTASAESGPYRGQSTGIKKGISRSVKL